MNKDKSTPEFVSGQLWIRCGQDGFSVAELIQQRIAGFKQTLFWLEPALQLNVDNTPGRLHNFAPLGEYLPKALPKLETAYIFGCDFDSDLPKGLQVIAIEKGCRWFEFSTREAENSTKIPVSKRSYPVLTRRDFERFFGSGEKPQWCTRKQLYVTEYWTEAGLLTWWLTQGEK